MKIEQYCKRRKERQKAETAGISFLRFCLTPCRGTCHSRDTAGKEKAPNVFRHRSKRNLTKKPPGRCGVRTVKGEASSRSCMPQSECGAGHAGQAYHRSAAGRITGHWRSLPQPSSAAWCPPPLYWSRVHSSHVASY